MLMRVTKNLTFIVFALCFESPFAANLPQGGTPWPWPWEVHCPIQWQNIIGEWTINAEDGSRISIEVTSGTGESSELLVHLRRSDNVGLHSEGISRVAVKQMSLVVPMSPLRSGVQPQVVTIRENCDRDQPGFAFRVKNLNAIESDSQNFLLERPPVR
jgi:hypothetical protein